METIALYVVAATLGSMVFFAAGIAPTVFQSLPEAEAGQFLRRLFPRYYLALILGAGIAGLCFAMTSPLAAAICFIIAGSTGWVRQILVPRINQLRDAELVQQRQLKFPHILRPHPPSVTLRMHLMTLAHMHARYEFMQRSTEVMQ